MKPVVLIPARLQSSRLPNKPLADIAGKPMVWHVWQRALEANVGRVVIATDSELIHQTMSQLGAEVVMTRADHTSGTERLAEASRLLDLSDDTPVVNVQGDEPLIAPAVIQQIAALLAQHPQASMASLWEPIHTATQLMNPNFVKVVTDQQGYALTFSRSPIPWHRDLFGSELHADTELPKGVPFCRHLGIYAYSSGFLRLYAQWPASEMECIEALEQLRVLWNGHKIVLAEACQPTHAGVDTPEDLARVRAVLNS
ncbi:MAG: 3-deoxy-manno-octulosonate cytidylyltransferase [Thiotrichales bacterium]|nr:MAG: 3-deoxy-manno-octulosonate cytidylyltransferase [Thiotrichales bacterium]